MKTYLHYIWHILKEHYKKDPLDIIMPIWFTISFAVIIGGCVMFFTAMPNRDLSGWWLLVVFMGVGSNPLIALPIAVWFETRYNNYRKWVNQSNSDNKTNGVE